MPELIKKFARWVLRKEFNSLLAERRYSNHAAHRWLLRALTAEKELRRIKEATCLLK